MGEVRVSNQVPVNAAQSIVRARTVAGWLSRMLASVVLLTSLVLSPTSSLLAAGEPFPFQEGDRVLMLGGTFIERDVNYGYLETAITAAAPQLNLTFRNLAWAGDTVWAESRGIFDPPAKGYERMLEQIQTLKPTVVLTAYGANESFAGEPGLAAFVAQYEKLIQDVNQAAGTNPRWILLTPHRFETPAPPLPDAAAKNPQLALYSTAIRQLAQKLGARLVDLYERTAPPVIDESALNGKLRPPRGVVLVNGQWRPQPLTENGVHLSRYGYLRVGRMLVYELGLQRPEFLVNFDLNTVNLEAARNITVTEAKNNTKQLSFVGQLSRLPEPPIPGGVDDYEFFSIAGGLAAGRFVLKIDGEPLTKNVTTLVGFHLKLGPDFEQAERLRHKIVEKNELFFHRWRPQNVTYLTGFRKHEQGNNAVEIPMFDALVERTEREFATLKLPVKHHYEIVPEDQP